MLPQILLIRVGMGDTFTEAGLRATDYLLPGDQTKDSRDK